MSDVSKQDCILDKWILQCTKFELAFIINNSNEKQKSLIILSYIGYINENAILIKFCVILSDLP